MLLEHPKVESCRRKNEILVQARADPVLVVLGLLDP